jgi:hypothetical protein
MEKYRSGINIPDPETLLTMLKGYLTSLEM